MGMWSDLYPDSQFAKVEEDIEGMQTMRFLGRNMAWLLKALDAAKKSGVFLPEQEEVKFTNFIRK